MTYALDEAMVNACDTLAAISQADGRDGGNA